MNAFLKGPFRTGLAGFVAAVLGLGCASRTAGALRPGQVEERASVQRRLSEIFDAAARKDLARLDGYHLYGPAFTKFSDAFPDRQDAVTAREAEHRGLSSIEGLRMEPEALKIDVFGEVAIATFVLEATFTAGDTTVQTKNRSTLVLVRADGSWKIVHEHFSPIQ